MKKINIYLVANEKEVVQDEKEISNFIRDLNDKFGEENIYFKLVTDEEMEGIDEEEIKKSELFFIIFCREIKDETIEKFNIAYENFIQKHIPKISTYIKEINEEADQSVINFMKKLGEELGHYYSKYENVDTIKLNIVLKLKTLGLSLGEMETKDGKLYLNNQEILTLDNIPILLNNKELTELKKEASELENDFLELSKKMKQEENNEEISKQFAVVSKRRRDVKDAIFDLEKKIIQLESSFVKISSEGKLSKRQIFAQECLEKGDINTAKEILDINSISEEVNRKLELQNLKKEDIIINVNELLQRIDTLEVDIKNKNRFNEIEEAYELAIKIEKQTGLYPKTLLSYGYYLSEQRKYRKSIQMLEQFIKYVEYKGETEETYKDIIFAYGSLGMNFVDLREMTEAEKYYKKALEYTEKIDDDGSFKASIYNDIAIIYMHNGEKQEEAEKYLRKGIEIDEKNGESGYGLIVSYINLEQLYVKMKKYNEAEVYIIKAAKEAKTLDITKTLNISIISDVFEGATRLYKDMEKYDKAEKYGMRAIELREGLAKENPERYNYKLVASYNDIAILYTNMEKFEEAEKYYKKTIEILEYIVKQEQKGNKDELAFIYKETAVLYYNMKRFEESEKYYKLAIKLKEELTQENKERNIKKLLEWYDEIIYFYKQMGKYEELEQYYKRLIKLKSDAGNQEINNSEIEDEDYEIAQMYEDDEIYVQAEKKYKQIIERQESLRNKEIGQNASLAYTYAKIAMLYKKMSENAKAITYYEKAIRIREELVKQDKDEYIRTLASAYNNMANIYCKMKNYEQSEIYYKKAIDLYEKEARQEKYLVLALYYDNMADLQEKIQKNNVAEKYYKKEIEMRENLVNQDFKMYSGSLKNAYNKIANLYVNKKKYKKAEEYYKKAIEVVERQEKEDTNKYKMDLISQYNEIIEKVYYNEKKYRQVVEYSKKIVEIFEMLNNSNYLSNLSAYYYQLANAYKSMKLYNDAENYYKKAQQIMEGTEEKGTIVILYIDILELYYDIKRYEQAENYGLMAENILNDLNNEGLENYNDCLDRVYEILAKTYLKLNIPDKALEYTKKWKTIN